MDKVVEETVYSNHPGELLKWLDFMVKAVKGEIIQTGVLTSSDGVNYSISIKYKTIQPVLPG